MPIDEQTSYPGYDGPILGSYAGAYDLAYIAFHPFVRIPGLDPAQCAPWTAHFSGYDPPSDLPLTDINARARHRRERERQFSPQLVDELAKRRGLALRWSEVGRATGLAKPANLNVALLTSIGALKPEYEDQAGAERLASYCSSQQIFLPTEGQFQAVMEQSLGKLFADAGIDRVEAADQFDEEARPIELDLLQSQQSWCSVERIPNRAGRIFAEDRSLLVVVDWDSFFTLICGKAERLQYVDMTKLFEGFWCGPDTTHSWWRHATGLEDFRH
jgi:hypothetical protein